MTRRSALTRALILLTALLAFARTAAAEVRLPDGEYFEVAEDLRVKVMGGSVAIARSWFRNQWYFNPAWSPLKFTYDNLDGSITSIDRAGWSYARKSGDVYAFDKRNTITRSTSGFVWQDRRGDRIDYDAQGRITSYSDRNDVSVSFEYDGQGRITGIRDHSGTRVLWYEYSGERLAQVHDYTGRTVEYRYTGTSITQVIDVLGNSWTYSYDSAGRLVAAGDPEQHARTITYGANGRVASVQEADGATTRYGYDYDSSKRLFYVRKIYPGGTVEELWFEPGGQMLRQDVDGQTRVALGSGLRERTRSDASDQRTIDSFDEWDNLVQRVHPDGSVETWEYDARLSLPTRHTDENGVPTTFEYDSHGNLLRQTRAAGRPGEQVTAFTYDAFGNRLSATRASGPRRPQVQYQYDGYGNLTRTIDPEGGVNTLTHDVLGDALSIVDARGKTWTFSYDKAGRRSAMRDPLGGEFTYGRDKVGNLREYRDSKGRSTTYEYDARNRLGKIIDPTGAEFSNSYSADGQLIGEVDEAGRTARYEFDTLHRLVGWIDGADNAIRFEYPAPGTPGSSALQPSKVSYPTYTRELTYDARGRLVASQDRDSAATSRSEYRYDPKGNGLAVADANANTVLYRYDALDRLDRIVDRVEGATTFEYDDSDNITTIHDPEGGSHRFEYDLAGRMTKEVWPGDEALIYTYDAAGNTKSITDPQGRLTEYSYDDRGRVAALAYSDAANAAGASTASFTYDSESNLVAWTDGAVSASLTYDALNRKLSETIDYGPFALTYRYGYYADGQKKTLTLPDGTLYSFGYAGNGELTSVAIPGHGDITVNALRWLVPTRTTWPGGASETSDYDGKLKLTQRRVATPDGQEVLMLENHYGPMDELLERIQNGTSTAFAFDREERLTQIAPAGAQAQTLTLDLLGNRVGSSAGGTTWLYDDRGRLQSADGVSFQYDDAGNLTQRIGPASTLSFSYDAAGRLAQVSQSGTVVARYGYDPFGRRLWKEAAGRRVYYLYSDEGLLGEYDDLGHEIASYGWHPQGEWGSSPLFMRRGGDYFHFHDNELGAPVTATAPGGRVVWSAQYDAYGKAAVAPGSTLTNNLRLPGQYYDEETGLHYNLMRYYDPSLGRYLRRDPMGVGDGLNPYLYAHGNPLKYVDPTGECGIFGALIGAGVDLALQLALNGGNLSCVSWTQVGLSGAMGAVCGAWFAGVFKHAKSGKSWWQLSQKWGNVSRRVKNAQGIPRDTELHHWFFQQNGTVGKHVPDAVKNHPWNLKPLPRDIHQQIHGNHPDLPQFDPIRRWWYGTPGWAKQAEGAAGAGAAADAATSGSCECGN